MAPRTLRVCAQPGCPELTDRARCPAHQPAPRKPTYRTPHQRTTAQRGYGHAHQQARRRLAAKLPAPCGYCARMLTRSDRWVAAHVIDGDPDAGWMHACWGCNEQAKRRRR